MQFTIVLPTASDSLPCGFTLEVHGRDPATKSVFVTLAGEERLVSTQDGQLLLSQPIKLQRTDEAGVTYMRPIERLNLDDLPQSLRVLLRAIRCAGPEVDLEFCESCGGLVPAHVITQRVLNLCPSCERGRKIKPTQDGIPF